jgi:hypothetical protein
VWFDSTSRELSLTLYWDTETELIDKEAGILAPPLVCLQYAFDDEEPRVLSARFDADEIREVLGRALDDHVMVAHNGAYDYAVLAAWDESFLPRMFEALAAKCNGRDTLLREQLIDIATGADTRPKGYYSLDSIAQRRCGMKLSKGALSWRLRYAELADKPVSAWPRPAVRYAEEDVIACRDVYRAQKYDSPDEWLQVASAFVLQLSAVHGARTDASKLEPLIAQLEAEKATALRSLIKQGLWNAEKESVDEKALKALIEEACPKAGIEVPRTEKGNTKKDAETVDKLGEQLPELSALVEYKYVDKILSTYCIPMRRGVSAPLVSSPNTLVGSGRTSWRDPNLQNFPRREGIRDCIVPRPGTVWCSVDYDSLELRTLAQCLLWIVGESRMAEGYRSDPDWDPHTALACSPELLNIPYEEGIRLKKAGDKKLKKYRQLGKISNFGLPGGAAAKSFKAFAEKTYGVLLTDAEAVSLRESWYATFPEMHRYFDYVRYLDANGLQYKQFVSERLRGGIRYTSIANTGFQGLAADGAKRALIRVSNACYCDVDSPLYGSRIICAIHDELCLEVPEERAHEAALETVRLMEEEMKIVCPDVPIRASPALSTCWMKAAEAKYRDGRLVCWDEATKRDDV